MSGTPIDVQQQVNVRKLILPVSIGIGVSLYLLLTNFNPAALSAVHITGKLVAGLLLGIIAMFVRCYFPEWSNTLKRRPSKKYPINPQTIGDHLLKRRLDLRLLQKDVAKRLGVTTDCITLWENGNSIPQIQQVPKIIEFLGHNPYLVKSKSLGGRIKNYRLLRGLSHKKLGKILGVDAATISTWEKGKFKPEGTNLQRLNELLSN